MILEERNDSDGVVRTLKATIMLLSFHARIYMFDL